MDRKTSTIDFLDKQKESFLKEEPVKFPSLNKSKTLFDQPSTESNLFAKKFDAVEPEPARVELFKSDKTEPEKDKSLVPSS